MKIPTAATVAVARKSDTELRSTLAPPVGAMALDSDGKDTCEPRQVRLSVLDPADIGQAADLGRFSSCREWLHRSIGTVPGRTPATPTRRATIRHVAKCVGGVITPP